MRIQKIKQWVEGTVRNLYQFCLRNMIFISFVCVICSVKRSNIRLSMANFQTVVKRGIAMGEATNALIQLIKDHGRWVDPPVEE